MPEANFKDQAECRKRRLPVEIFVHDPEDPRHEEWSAKAKDACRNCPVQAECFMFGLTNNEQGIWGGTFLDGNNTKETE